MTIPTIAELTGNTILELFKSGYNALRKALGGKQDTLVAGSNIVINGNTISAIEGGTAVLDDYYTKEEVDGIATELSADINDKADSDDVYTKSQVDTELATKADTATTYTKSEVDALIDDVSSNMEIIEPELIQTADGVGITEEIKDGDIVVVSLKGDNYNYAGGVFTKRSSGWTNITNIQIDEEDSTDFNINFESITVKQIIDHTLLVTVFGYYTSSITVANGNEITLLEPTVYTTSAQDSKITIYRKKEVTE